MRVQDELFVRDYDKCVLCYKCVEACGDDAQRTYAISISGRGFDARVSTEHDVALPEGWEVSEEVLGVGAGLAEDLAEFLVETDLRGDHGGAVLVDVEDDVRFDPASREEQGHECDRDQQSAHGSPLVVPPMLGGIVPHLTRRMEQTWMTKRTI